MFSLYTYFEIDYDKIDVLPKLLSIRDVKINKEFVSEIVPKIKYSFLMPNILMDEMTFYITRKKLILTEKINSERVFANIKKNLLIKQYNKNYVFISLPLSKVIMSNGNSYLIMSEI